jgi:hypothetical protein
MTRLRHCARALWIGVLLSALPAQVSTHSGPPFPLVSDRVAGAYQLSLWTDPDATADGSAAGQFWVMIRLADGSAAPPGTQATVTIRALDRNGPEQSARAAPVNGEISRQFVALLMDHEGPFAVRTAIDGARGAAVVDTTVDATYDLRPARWLIAVYLMPFGAVGFLWLKVLFRRRARLPVKPS